MSSIQPAINIAIDVSTENGNCNIALKFLWLSHANNSATYEPDEIARYMQELMLYTGKELPILCN